MEREIDRLRGSNDFFSLKVSIKFSSCLMAQAVRQHKKLELIPHLIKESTKTVCSEKDFPGGKGRRLPKLVSWFLFHLHPPIPGTQMSPRVCPRGNTMGKSSKSSVPSLLFEETHSSVTLFPSSRFCSQFRIPAPPSGPCSLRSLHM